MLRVPAAAVPRLVIVALLLSTAPARGQANAVEPVFSWRGSMLAHAQRDPIFWASVAISEQDFLGSGDLCIRSHVANAWTAGQSTPTVGPGLQNNNSTAVACDVRHQLTNPDDSAHLGIQNVPYVDGTVRTFTCQTCHMPPVFGEGCNKGVPPRADLPLHNLVGANYWMPDMLLHLDALGQLVGGPALRAEEMLALPVGGARWFTT